MDFNILHLSDLHVKDTKQLQLNLEKLLSDISEQVNNVREIIVVVTGDIVDKGIYNDNSEKNVLDFFNRLKAILETKFKSILIVPGNHDRVQCSTSNIILNHLRDTGGLINNITTEDWNYHLLSYKNFLRLEDKIYDIFYPNSVVPIHHTQTFGVEKYINNESVILFIKLDTSWCSLGGEKDKRKLHISNYQLDLLKNEYQKLKNEEKGKNILTIALCHHPMKWLADAEEDFLYSYFISEEYLNVDIVLCGHVHDIEINNMYNSFHQITTLLTGIGWKENAPSDKKNGHRYSIYVFNLRRNSCEAIVRKTDSSGNFDIDRDFLPDKHSKNTGKFSIPIILKNNYPYIEIPAFDDNELKYIPLFIDKKILTDIKNYTWSLSQLLSFMREDLITYRQNALEDFNYHTSKSKTARESVKKYFDSGEITQEVSKILGYEDNKKLIYMNFSTYLYEICNHFIDLFKKYYSKKGTDDIRIFLDILIA